MTHTDIQQRMSPLTEWLTACSHTRLIPQHNAGLHTHAHSKTCDIQVLSLLSNTLTLSISHKLWLAQNHTVCRSAPTAPCLHCAAAGKRTGGTILAGWSEGLWERKRREGGREGGMTTGCVGEWTAHQAIGKVAPLAVLSLSFPPKHNNPPISWKCHNQSLGRTPEVMSITGLTNLVMSAGSYDKRDPVLSYSAGRGFEESDEPSFRCVCTCFGCLGFLFFLLWYWKVSSIVFLTIWKFKFWCNLYLCFICCRSCLAEHHHGRCFCWCQLVVHLSHCLYKGLDTSYN